MNPSGRSHAQALTLVMALSLVLAGLTLLVGTQPAAAAIVVEVDGDWVVSGTDNVYDGVIFKVDGNVTIETGAVLEIRNGGLVFLQDSNHVYSLDIQDGASGHGALILDGSVLTTEPNQLADYLKLDISVAGTLLLRDGSALKHPGTLTTTGDALLEVTDSSLTGFTLEEVEDFLPLAAQDDHDDAPVMDFTSSSSVLFANAEISRLYENASVTVTDDRFNLTVRDSATLTVIDSFVGVDYLDAPAVHNIIVARNSAQVYLYNMTLDQVQSDTDSPSNWVSALVANGTSSSFYIHRWLDVQVTDRFGAGTAGAYVEARIIPQGALAYFPENGDATVPGSTLLDYMGRTAGTWNVTDANGRVRMPLQTEWIDASLTAGTQPNSHFEGNYRIRSSFSGAEGATNLSFPAYPSLSAADNVLFLTEALTDLVWPSQDRVYLWDEPMTIDYDLELDGTVRVSAPVRLEASDFRILQGDLESGRHYLIVEGSGSLILEGGSLSSNLPLVVYLRDNGQFTASGTDLFLNAGGRGVLYAEDSASFDVRDGLLEGDVHAFGGDAGLRNLTIGTSDLVFNNTGTSSLWSPTFEEGVSLALLSDDGDVNTLDFDIRNVTFDEDLAPAVFFTGTQYAQLTATTFPGTGDWWTGRIFDGAKVSNHWWLMGHAVDGVGEPVGNVSYVLAQLDPATLTFQPISPPAAEDLYYATFDGGTIFAPNGTFLYRAQVQERFASTGWSNATYRVNASVDLDGLTIYAENEAKPSLAANEDVELVFFNWPDLRIGPSDITLSRTPVEGATVGVEVAVHNDGKADARAARVEVYDNGQLADTGFVDVPLGSTVAVSLEWVPNATGARNLTVWVQSANDTQDNTDLDQRNNRVNLSVVVLTKPDLELRAPEYQGLAAVEGRSFTVEVTVYNTGSTVADDFDVALYLDEVSPGSQLALLTGLTVPGNSNLTVLMEADAVDVEGNYTLIILADASNVIPETSEANNRVNAPLLVVPPEGSVFLNLQQTSYSLGQEILVTGQVTTPTGQPLPGMRLTVLLRDPEGTVWDSREIVTDANGAYVLPLQIPEQAPTGTWTVSAIAEAETIQIGTGSFTVTEVVPWYLYEVPVVGLPVWMFLAVLAIFLLVVAAIGGYMKAFGLGRLAECGECGALIRESASSCPKCGTEFEHEMAKCSSCHAWIPADVKRCPECGVEFTSGKAKTADYKKRMRKQYEKVVDKYRAEAARALGHRPSEKEFQEWWRRQPTYVTFDRWLKEEEEMRKMGSKPCPRCNALNSVSAKICHRCGTLMAGDAPKGKGGSRPPPRSPPPSGGKAGGSGDKKAVLRKLVKKATSKKDEK